jgi:hypothetical protein
MNAPSASTACPVSVPPGAGVVGVEVGDVGEGLPLVAVAVGLVGVGDPVVAVGLALVVVGDGVVGDGLTEVGVGDGVADVYVAVVVSVPVYVIAPSNHTSEEHQARTV